jgi:hypothetical protein
MPRRRLRAISTVTAALCASQSLAGPAVNQFETKDLESAPGQLQFQSQNAISFGQPKRQVAQSASGLAFDDNTIARERYALEMQMGITSWFRTRVGVEFEKARIEDPSSLATANAFENLHLTGIAVEGVFIVVPVSTNGFGLGLLTEYDSAVGGGQSQFYIGPIIQAVSGPWSALANLLLVQNYGSPDRGRLLPSDTKRDFAYAAQLQYTLSSTWAVAFEGYGTIDRLGHSGHQAPEQASLGRFDQHRLGPVVYYRINTAGLTAAATAHKATAKALKADDDKDGTDKDKSISVGVGLLFGLNANTPDQTLKLSLEWNF